MSLLIAVKSTSEATEFRRPQQRPIPGRPIKHGLITSADASRNGLSISDPHLTPGHANNDQFILAFFSPNLHDLRRSAARRNRAINPLPAGLSSASKCQVKQRPQRQAQCSNLLPSTKAGLATVPRSQQSTHQPSPWFRQRVVAHR